MVMASCFVSVSLEYSTFESPARCSDAIVCWYLPPIYCDCEHQDRPLGGSCYCILTPAGVTHGNSPMVHPHPLSSVRHLWPALRGVEEGRPFKGPESDLVTPTSPCDGWDPRTALAAVVVTVWAGLAFHPQSSSQILTKERKWRSVSDGWDQSPFLENKTLRYFPTL